MTTSLRRYVTAEIEARDGREVFGRIVPYGVVASVGADPPDLPFAIQHPYREMFEGGYLRKASRAPDRIALSLEHDLTDGLASQLGYGTELRDESDGAYGAFRVFKTIDGDKALELVDAKILKAFSVGFVPLSAPRVTDDGTVVRTRIRLDEVALCRAGAYATAEVHGRRNDPPDDGPTVEPWVLRDRLKALGYIS